MLADRSRLFPDTEVAEDHVQQFVDPHRAGDAAKRTHGQSKILGSKRHFGGGESAAERCMGIEKRLAVAGAGVGEEVLYAEAVRAMFNFGIGLRYPNIVMNSGPATLSWGPPRWTTRGEAPLVLLVNPGVPGTDYKSTMAAIAKEPKKYFFALSSGGSAGHIATLEFLRRTKLPLDTILYKGTAPANADLISGSVQLFMDPWTALLPLAKAGKTRALFVTSRERTELAPDIRHRRPHCRSPRELPRHERFDLAQLPHSLEKFPFIRRQAAGLLRKVEEFIWVEMRFHRAQHVPHGPSDVPGSLRSSTDA